MSFYQRTEMYAIYNKNDEYTGQQFTQAQILVVFGNNNLDFYENEENKYYRIYNEDLEDSEKLYTKVYTNPPDLELDTVNKRVIRGMVSEDLPEELLQNVFDNEWIKVRENRNFILRQSDFESFIMIPDVWSSKSEEYRSQWLIYRKKLRDIPQDFTNPFELIWPEKPTIEE